MNNIEILEEFIKHYKEVQEKYKDDEIQAEIERSCYFEEVPAEAIENLIQENKELKEKQKEYEKQLDLDYVEENYIPKSKVKEKMQKDIKINEHVILGGRRNGKTLEYGKRLGRIEMCEELLEEGE